MARAALPSDEPARRAQCQAAANAADALNAFLTQADTRPGVLVPLQVGDGDVALQVPAGAVSLLRDVLDQLGEGHDVELMPQTREVSTEFAARLLGVSRPHFVKLLEHEHVMDFHKVGRDRRVQLADVLAYRRDLRDRRARARRELVSHSEDIGLYDDED